MTPPNRLHERYGEALRQQRNRHGVTQSGLAKLVGLSLKYIGEIERGDANVTMDVQDRLAQVLDWNPFQPAPRVEDALPDGLGMLLLTNLQHITQFAQTGADWLQRLGDALTRRAAQTFAETPPERPRRGRPRKSRLSKSEPS